MVTLKVSCVATLTMPTKPMNMAILFLKLSNLGEFTGKRVNGMAEVDVKINLALGIA